MNKINPNADKDRETLRRIGKIVLTFGVIMAGIGFFSFFSSIGSFEGPRYFWCTFIGMPAIAAGLIMLKFGYLGTIIRYFSGEAAPVAKDSINYMGKETKEGVRHFSQAIFEGINGAKNNKQSVEERLKRLTELRNNNLITEEEFDTQKNRILNEL